MAKVSMASKGRPVEENGYMISKRFQEKTDTWTKDGKTFPGREEQHLIMVASSYEDTKEKGLLDPTVLEYEVSKEVFDKACFMDSFRVRFELNLVSQRVTPISAVALKK